MSSTKQLIAYMDEHQREYIDALKGAVCLETPTEGSREDLDGCREYFAELFRSEGFLVTEVKNYNPGYADHLLMEYGKNAGDAAEKLLVWQDANKKILADIYEGKAPVSDLPKAPWDGGSGEYVLFGGHYDTVHKKGAFENIWEESEDKISGPGILDMKGGVVMVWMLIKALKESGLFPEDGYAVFFLSGDEETGSLGSSEYYKELARHAKAAFIMEPSAGVVGVDSNDAGCLKAGRYGRGNYTFTAEGKPYHSGINPTLAESSLIELAKQAVRLEEMTFFDRINEKTGLPETVTVGCVCLDSGNAKWCTIPGEGSLTIDARYSNMDLAEEYDKVFQNLVSFNLNVKIKTSGGIEKPPFDKDVPGNKKLQDIAANVGKDLGVEMKMGVVRSGSDGNFTSAVGCPTLDGMGMTGDHIHQLGEYINKKNIPVRLAFAAEMFLRVMKEK